MIMYKLDIELINNKMIYLLLLASTNKDILEMVLDYIRDKDCKDIVFELIEED